MQILQNTYTCFTGTCHIVIKSYSSSFMKYKEEKRPIKRNLDGWIYFFYSKFKKITCLLISWSTNKHIDTNIRYLKKKIPGMDIWQILDHCRGDGYYLDQTLLLVQKRGQGIPHDAIQSGHRETGEDLFCIDILFVIKITWKKNPVFKPCSRRHYYNNILISYCSKQWIILFSSHKLLLKNLKYF